MIDLLEVVAVEAGQEITRLLGQGLTFTVKADGSQRSNADVASEKIITDRLRSALPSIPIIAEEAVDDGFLPHGNFERFFLVDPLDGTRELAAGNGQYAVNIALVENGRPVLGVVFAPAENRLYTTRANTAMTALASSNGQIGPADIITCRPSKTASRGIVSRSRSDEAIEFLTAMGISDVVKFGSTLKFCKVAEGFADIYVSKGATREWDTAAGDAIIKAAGGEVVQLDSGAPLVYGKSTGVNPFLHGDFIARARIIVAP